MIYTTIHYIVEKLNSFNIPGGYWNLAEIKEWTYDALSIIGTIENKIEAIKKIEIIDGKGQLPSNLIDVVRVLEGDSDYPMEFVNTGQTFTTDLQYKIFNSHIYPNFDNGFVNLYYLALPEEDGLPLIPDNSYFISAVLSYYRFKIGERAYWQNRILENQLNRLEQEWLFYIPAAKGSMKMNILKQETTFKKINMRHIF
jgi:hypothetical protein